MTLEREKASLEIVTAEGWRGAGAPGGAQLRASTDGGAQRQDPDDGNWRYLFIPLFPL